MCFKKHFHNSYIYIWVKSYVLSYPLKNFKDLRDIKIGNLKAIKGTYAPQYSFIIEMIIFLFLGAGLAVHRWSMTHWFWQRGDIEGRCRHMLAYFNVSTFNHITQLICNEISLESEHHFFCKFHKEILVIMSLAINIMLDYRMQIVKLLTCLCHNSNVHGTPDLLLWSVEYGFESWSWHLSAVYHGKALRTHIWYPLSDHKDPFQS